MDGRAGSASGNPANPAAAQTMSARQALEHLISISMKFWGRSLPGEVGAPSLSSRTSPGCVFNERCDYGMRSAAGRARPSVPSGSFGIQLPPPPPPGLRAGLRSLSQSCGVDHKHPLASQLEQTVGRSGASRSAFPRVNMTRDLAAPRGALSTLTRSLPKWQKYLFTSGMIWSVPSPCVSRAHGVRAYSAPTAACWAIIM